jgi:hypothetical protein
MSEVKRYVHKPEKMQKVSRFYGPNSERQYTLAKDFDRVTAERDALQVLLTAADERADVLEGLLRRAGVLIHDFQGPISLRLDIDAALNPAEVISHG